MCRTPDLVRHRAGGPPLARFGQGALLAVMVSCMGCARHARPVFEVALPPAGDSLLRLAWAPDGTELAWVDAGVARVWRLDADEPVRLNVAQPLAVQYDDAGTLHALDAAGALHRFGGEGSNPEASVTVLVDLNATSADIEPLTGGAFLVASHRVEDTSFGVAANSDIGVFAEGRLEEVHHYSVAFPPHTALPYGHGAVTVGSQHPRRATFVISEFHAPPRFPAYHRLVEVDPGSGELTRLLDFAAGGPVLHVDWAPDGTTAVIGAADGSVLLLDEESWAVSRLDTEARGIFPAFSPGGDHLFVGGTLIRRDGTVVARLGDGALDSRGWFSPTGHAIAIQQPGGELGVLEFEPSLASALSPRPGVSATGEKVRRLQQLLRQELITPDDYRQRKARLLGGPESPP